MWKRNPTEFQHRTAQFLICRIPRSRATSTEALRLAELTPRSVVPAKRAFTLIAEGDQDLADEPTAIDTVPIARPTLRTRCRARSR